MNERSDLAVRYNVADSGVHVVEVRASRPITGHDMRSIRFRQFTRQWVRDALTITPPPKTNGRYRDADILPTVAAVVRECREIGYPNHQSILMDLLEAPRSTVGYWIKRARAEGLLDEEAS